MTTQAEFDRLRQTCSNALAQFIAAAHETERRMQQLRLPVGVAADERFLSQRGAEFDACYVYLVAARQLADFLARQLQSVN